MSAQHTPVQSQKGGFIGGLAHVLEGTASNTGGCCGSSGSSADTCCGEPIALVATHSTSVNPTATGCCGEAADSCCGEPAVSPA